MNSQTVTIAEGAGFNQSLGFAARTAIVDNYTGSYLYLTQADRHVAPYTTGFTTPITPTDAPVVEWATPATIPIQPVTGGQAKIIFTDASLPPSNGTTVYRSDVTGALNTATNSIVCLDIEGLTITPGNTSLLIAGSVGKVLTIFAWHFNVRAGGPVGVYLVRLRSDNAFGPYDFVGTASLSVASFAGVTGQTQGAALPQGLVAMVAGRGLEAICDASSVGSVVIDGNVYYSQA